MGRVDGIALELRRGAAPRITAIGIGGRVWAARVHPRIATWAAALARRWPSLANGVTRIPMDQVRHVGVTVSVKCDGRTTPALAWEQWLRRNVISRIPGA
jgi:hypothetical protein